MDTPDQWIVTTPNGTAHTYEDELAAWQWAAQSAYNDRASRVRYPQGNTFLVIRPREGTTLQAVRPL
jgi:hypothetical protein